MAPCNGCKIATCSGRFRTERFTVDPAMRDNFDRAVDIRLRCLAGASADYSNHLHAGVRRLPIAVTRITKTPKIYGYGFDHPCCLSDCLDAQRRGPFRCYL